MAGKREATIDDLCQVEGKAEIVRGELVRMTPTGGLHGNAVVAIAASLYEHGRRTKQGLALADNVGFIVNLPNRRSFSPDVAFWTGGPLSCAFIEGAPIFAAEVTDDAERRLGGFVLPAMPGQRRRRARFPARAPTRPRMRADP